MEKERLRELREKLYLTEMALQKAKDARQEAWSELDKALSQQCFQEICTRLNAKRQ